MNNSAFPRVKTELPFCLLFILFNTAVYHRALYDKLYLTYLKINDSKIAHDDPLRGNMYRICDKIF